MVSIGSQICLTPELLCSWPTTQQWAHKELGGVKSVALGICEDRWPGLPVRISTYPSPDCGLSPAPPRTASCNPPTAGSSPQGTEAPVVTGCASPRCSPLSRSVRAIQPSQRDPVSLEVLRGKEQKKCEPGTANNNSSYSLCAKHWVGHIMCTC